MEERVRKEVNLDSVLDDLGPFGNYNKLNFALLLLPIFLSGFYECGYIFEAPQQKYRCEIPECETTAAPIDWKSFAIPHNDTSCKRFATKRETANISSIAECAIESFDNTTVKDCERYVYDGNYSVVKDFNLGCKEWKRTLIGTVHNSGMFVALLLTGTISDKYGRKVALGLSCLANFIFGFSRAFALNYDAYVSLHFLEAAFGGGLYTSSFVLAVELVGPKQRVLVTSLFNITFVMGLVVLAGLAWWLENWKHQLLVMYSPAILVVLYVWFMRESARWLLSKGRREDAIKVLEAAAKMNKLQTKDLELENLSSPLITDESKIENTKSEFSQAMKSGIIWRRLLTCSFLWVTCTFVYYGMSINSVSLAGNKYVNFILVVIVEVPANLLVIVILDKYGRKRTIVVTFITSGIMCLSFAFLPSDAEWWSLALYLLGKSSVTLTYSSVYIYVSEVFPTSMRQTLISICSTNGRFGSLLAPLTPLLATYYRSMPSIIFGCMSMAASFLMFLLPETNNIRLPDTIEEAEQLSRKRGNQIHESVT